MARTRLEGTATERKGGEEDRVHREERRGEEGGQTITA